MSTNRLDEPSSYPLFAEGWGERSIFGWDPLEQSWWAQLWPDSSPSDEPDIWLGVSATITSLCDLTRLIAKLTGLSERRVDQIIGQTLNPIVRM